MGVLERSYGSEVEGGALGPPATEASELSTQGSLDAETERAARTFLSRLRGRYSVRECVVFGSRARGTHAPESDIDLAVVLDGPEGNRIAVALDMAGIAFGVMLETNLLVEALPLWRDELGRPETFRNADLIQHIRRDGIRL